MIELNEILAVGDINWETYSRAAKMAQKTLEETGAAGDVVFKRLEDAGVTAFDNLSDAMIEFGATGKFQWRDLARVALTAIRDIMAAYSRTGVLGASFGNIFASLVTGIFGFGGGGFTAGTSLSIGAFPSFAHGGRIAAGQLAMVGEGGRELFQPSVAGNILSNRDTEKAISGGGDTFIIDATGADAEGMQRLESLIATLDGSIERRSVAAMVNQSRRQPVIFG